MGLLSALFSREPNSAAVLRAVEKIESIWEPAEAPTLDAGLLPMDRSALKKGLVAEMRRLCASPGGEIQARRYAHCYVALAYFQPGLDASSERLRRAFSGEGDVRTALLGLRGSLDSHEDCERFIADLEGAGLGHLVDRTAFQ
jgi:hypothetical protein